MPIPDKIKNSIGCLLYLSRKFGDSEDREAVDYLSDGLIRLYYFLNANPNNSVCKIVRERLEEK
jgi:hypothetical protein